jgi:hypothetical protein
VSWAAYAFGAENGLAAEIDDIRNMEIGWDLSYTSSVRRGYVFELFQKRHLLKEFNAKYWPYGNTAGGLKECERLLRIKERYDEFLQGKAPAMRRAFPRKDTDGWPSHANGRHS